MPPPGESRLPQIYVYWDSSDSALKLPWAAPNSAAFQGEQAVQSGLEARVEIVGSSQISELKEKVQDWNSRPFDLIVVGPSIAAWKALSEMSLPGSEAAGLRIFLSAEAPVGTQEIPGWNVLRLDEGAPLKLLQELCSQDFGEGLKGCRFSEAAVKKKAIADLPVGTLPISFAKSSPVNGVQISLAWNQLFLDALAARKLADKRITKKLLQMSDGDIHLEFAKELGPKVNAFLISKSLGFLSNQGDLQK